MIISTASCNNVTKAWTMIALCTSVRCFTQWKPVTVLKRCTKAGGKYFISSYEYANLSSISWCLSHLVVVETAWRSRDLTRPFCTWVEPGGLSQVIVNSGAVGLYRRWRASFANFFLSAVSDEGWWSGCRGEFGLAELYSDLFHHPKSHAAILLPPFASTEVLLPPAS